jgi:hypothetical protein
VRKIRRELYNEFIEWCNDENINECLRKALEILKMNNQLSDQIKKDLDREKDRDKKATGLYRFSK